MKFAVYEGAGQLFLTDAERSYLFYKAPVVTGCVVIERDDRWLVMRRAHASEPGLKIVMRRDPRWMPFTIRVGVQIMAELGLEKVGHRRARNVDFRQDMVKGVPVMKMAIDDMTMPDEASESVSAPSRPSKPGVGWVSAAVLKPNLIALLKAESGLLRRAHAKMGGSVVYDIIAGRADKSRLETVRRLASALGVDVAVLTAPVTEVEEKGEAPTPPAAPPTPTPTPTTTMMMAPMAPRLSDLKAALELLNDALAKTPGAKAAVEEGRVVVEVVTTVRL